MTLPSALLAWLGRAAASLAAIGQTRLELAANELEEERLHIAGQLLLAALALFCIGIGLLLASLLLVVLFWDAHRVAVLSVLVALYLGAGAALAWRWRVNARAKPPLLAQTLEELRRDIAALRGEAP